MVKHSHKCQNPICIEISTKDKYGNYKRYCSNECMQAGRSAKFKETYTNKDTGAILAKRKATVQEKYGVDNVSKTAEVKAALKISTRDTTKERLKNTKKNNLEKYGVESTNSLATVKALKKSNYKKKTGFDHQLKDPAIAAKVSAANTKNADERLALAKITNLEKYGCENPSSNAEVKQKRTNTMIERFGVENASQNAEVHAKKMTTGYQTKEFIFPSGKKIMVQGYEPQAITKLLQIYSEEEIITETLLKPAIPYKDKEGKNHIYFPDIYIPKDNKLIEVKSQYTFDGFVGWKETNLLKQQASISAGYSHDFMIMGKK